MLTETGCFNETIYSEYSVFTPRTPLLLLQLCLEKRDRNQHCLFTWPKVDQSILKTSRDIEWCGVT